MKASVLNLKSVFILSALLIALTSCEKEEVLEAPQNMDPAREHIEQYALNNDSVGLSLNRLESLPLEGMYQKKVFSSLKKVNTYNYGSFTDNSYELFEAAGNHVPNRPLVMLAPGGGWNSHTELPKLRLLAEDLALRGYVVAVVKYHVDPNTPAPTFDEQHKSVRDIRSAVRYFKINASNLNIDPENIFIGGWSTGSVISMVAAYVESEVELLEISEQPIRDGFLNSVNNLGYDNNENLGPNNKVRGVLAMFTYMLQKTFIDAGEPALMMINHENAHFQNGTKIIGKVSMSGATIYGTDTLNGRALAEGFVAGQDLEYKRMSGTYLYKGSNETSMWDGHWDDIAEFFYRNMKQ